MTYPFVEAGSYRLGRTRAIRLICVHSTESPCAGYAPRIANYFAGGPGVSSHYVCDDTTTIQCVHDEDTAFTAPNANADGLHVEQCGFARWTRTEWLTGAPARMLAEQVAPLLAHLAAKHSIPLRWLTPAQVAAGERGLCQHWDVTQAYPGTGSHWDCGTGYPADRVLELATNAAPIEPAAPPARRRPTVIPATLRPNSQYIYDVSLVAEGEQIATQAGGGPKVAAATLVVRQAVVGAPPVDVTITWGSGKADARRGIGGAGEVYRFPCPHTGLASVTSPVPLAVHGEVYVV